MHNDGCVVLLSGGQDSTTVLHEVKTCFMRVEALVVDYGQRHSRAIGAARAVAAHAGVFLHEARMKLPDLSSALTDGHTGGPRAGSWSSMVQRCTNFGHISFDQYGGAGITVCDAWLGRGGFARFFKHMGARPEGMTLDRVDRAKGYAPGNTRWATVKEQNVNRDTGRLVRTHPETGESKGTAEWARLCGISVGAMRVRLARGEKNGWPLARALTEKGTKR